jgi:hypothetical protein
MDWSGVLGFALALGIISLVFLGAENVMGYLERLFGASETWPDPECVTPRDIQNSQ